MTKLFTLDSTIETTAKPLSRNHLEEYSDMCWERLYKESELHFQQLKPQLDALLICPALETVACILDSSKKLK